MKTQNKLTILEKTYAGFMTFGLVATSLVLSNTVTEADNLFGERCGPDLVCSGEQTCQLQLNGQPVGTLPGQTEINLDPTTGAPITDITYQCIDPPQLEAPDSIYRGPQTDGYNTSNPRPGDPGVPVNIINQGPVPVDIFNPLPVPTNIVSPNPVPVVVVDDLALYQQARIDEYVTEQTTNQTLAETQQIALQGAQLSGAQQSQPLQFENARSAQSAQIEATREAVNNPNPFVDPSIATEFVAQRATDVIQNEAQATPLDESEYTQSCSGADPLEAGLNCAVLALQETPANYLLELAQNFDANQEIAVGELRTQRITGDGYYAITEGASVFEEIILTPAKHVAETVQEFVGSKLEQVLGAGANCTEAQGLGILEQTIEPVFQDGLYQVANVIDLDNIDPTNPGEGLEQIADTFRQVGQDIFNSLLQGISCELGAIVNDVVGPWLDGLLEV